MQRFRRLRSNVKFKVVPATFAWVQEWKRSELLGFYPAFDRRAIRGFDSHDVRSVPEHSPRKKCRQLSWVKAIRKRQSTTLAQFRVVQEDRRPAVGARNRVMNEDLAGEVRSRLSASIHSLRPFSAPASRGRIDDCDTCNSEDSSSSGKPPLQ